MADPILEACWLTYPELSGTGRPVALARDAPTHHSRNLGHARPTHPRLLDHQSQTRTRRSKENNEVTEAEMAIRKAIQLIDVQWGNGRFDKAELMHTLKEGLPKTPERVVRRPNIQGDELRDLDDNGGH